MFNYSEASWKRPDTGERVSGFDREDVFRPVESSQMESAPDFPKPAEGKKTILNVCVKFVICKDSVLNCVLF